MCGSAGLGRAAFCGTAKALFSWGGLVGIVLSVAATSAAVPSALEILDAATIRGGVVVHLGCGDGRLTAALRATDAFVVHGLDADPKNVAEARKHIQSLGLYGNVSVDQWHGGRLPYVDNFANLIVVADGASVADDEIMRALAPNGTALVGGKKLVKPWSPDIDEWTHYLHGPDNNAVAKDTVVGPPKHYQWIGSPDYLRHHDHLSGLSAMVSAKGRLFYIMDLGPRWSVQMPAKWTLMARDAFNGTILWQRPIGEWHPHLWGLKHGPAQIMRRLVAVGSQVYVTLAYGGPISVLDAVTGKTLRTLDATTGAEEIIVADDVLYALVNPEGDVYRTIPKASVDSIRTAARNWNWDERPRRLMAIGAHDGRTLWSKEFPVVPGTLGAAGGRVVFHDGEKVVCLGARDGATAWTSKPVPRLKPMHVMFNPTLIVYGDVILFAGGEKFDPQRGGKDTMTAFSSQTGEVLWTAPHPQSGYASAEDLFVAQGLVWCGTTSGPRDSGVFTGRDPRTGEVRVEFSPDDWKHMPHHRCHRSKATCNFILTSRTGVEFVDLNRKHWTDHNWVRGSCNYGVLPCNGLLYAGPHSCACFLLAKLNGMNALAAESASRRLPEKISDEGRLTVGDAGEVTGGSGPGDWPTFRHDAARSGATDTAVPTGLKLSWAADVGGRLSTMTASGGIVFVSSVDAHTVHGLDAASGKKLWSRTVGGRVDSPPSIWNGRAIFGSADGHVYCLRASDGALIWKFRAAPEDRRLMAQEQIESVWPVSGSVLIREGNVYCVAGRAMWLDGGLRLLRLDASSGRKLSETIMDDRYPGTGDNLQKDVRWPNLPVALPDILSCDDRRIYMRSQPFDFDGARAGVVTPSKFTEQGEDTAHLFSATGFLDGSFWHRTYWMWGQSFISGAGGWYLAGYRVPAGNILVADATRVFGFGYAPLKFTGTAKSYHLFGCPKYPKLIDTKKPIHTRGKAFWGDATMTKLSYDWSQSAPVIGKALVLAHETLFVAGPPTVVDEQDVSQRWGDPELQAKMVEQIAAFEGRKGGLLFAVSKGEGKQLAAYRLHAPPVFDGMIAANRCLYLATMDGRVLCFGEEGKALEKAGDVGIGPLTETGDRAVSFAPTASHPDFQKIENVRITTSDIGYRFQPARGAVGLALRALQAPLTKVAVFRVRVRTTPGASSPDTPGNGFLVFGDSPDDARLIKCGYRISGKALMITQGAMGAKPKNVSHKAELRANAITDLTVTVDLDAQKVTLAGGGQSVVAPLASRLDAIHWVGCCVQSVTTDFSAIEIGAEEREPR